MERGSENSGHPLIPCEIRKALANRTAFSATGSCAIVPATHPPRMSDDEAFVEGAKSGKAGPLPVVTISVPISPTNPANFLNATRDTRCRRVHDS